MAKASKRSRSGKGFQRSPYSSISPDPVVLKQGAVAQTAQNLDDTQALIQRALETAQQLMQAGQLETAIAQCHTLLSQYEHDDHDSHDGHDSHVATAMVASDAASSPLPLATAAQIASIHHLLGVGLLQQQHYDVALQHFQQAMVLNSTVSETYNFAGVACFRLGDPNTGIDYYQQAVTLAPQALDMRYNLALGLQKTDRVAAAIPHFEVMVQQEPRHIAAHYQLGNGLQSLGQVADAIAHYQHALDLLNQKDAIALPTNRPFPIHREQVWYNLGVAQQEQGEMRDAEAAYRQAIALRPDYGEVLNALGTILEKQEKMEEAIAQYQQALQLLPDYPPLLTNLGNLQLHQKHWSEAEFCFRHLLEIDSDNLKAIDGLIKLALQTSHWQDLACLTQQLWQLGKETISTDIAIYHTLFLDLSPHQLKILAQNHATAIQQRLSAQKAEGRRQKIEGRRQKIEGRRQKAEGRRPTPKSRLNLGYVSGDYRNQAVAHLIYRLFELHDRQRFQVYAYSLGPNDGSKYRQKFEADADIFRDVKGWASEKIAQQIQDDNIHILIDLEGYTQYAQVDIYARRPAPIIMTYLGHPGTMGANYIDYLITDIQTTPSSQTPYLSEQCIYLPTSHLLTDDQQAIANQLPQRKDLGLPKDGVVFCAFHKISKIEPQVFSVWMQILQDVPGSVIWLKSVNAVAQENLRSTAIAHGVAGDRLIFTAPIPDKADYLAHYALADVFLDTFHHTAAVTGVDVLWAGLPLLTVAGTTFSSRLSSSLLTALDLTECICPTPADYYQKAITLATQPSQLKALKQKLQQNCSTSSLFNSQQTVSHLETAYQMAWTRYKAGQAPQSFTVPCQPASGTASTKLVTEKSAVEHYRQGMGALKNHQAEIALNHFDTALRLAVQANSLQPNSLSSDVLADYYNHAGVACFQLGHFEAGLAHYQAAVDLQPQGVSWRYNLAIALQKVRHYPAAISEFAKILDQESNLLAARYQLGNCYQKQQQFDKAIAHYQHCIQDLSNRAIATAPINQQFSLNRANLWHNLGTALKHQIKINDAEQAFRQAIAHKPRHADALLGLSQCLQRQHQWEEAITSLQKAIALKSDNLDWLVHLGKLHLRQQQWQKAETCFQQALSHAPNHLSAIDGMVQLTSYTCQWKKLQALTQKLWQLGKETISTDIQIYQTLFLDLSPHQLKILAQNHATAIQQQAEGRRQQAEFRRQTSDSRLLNSDSRFPTPNPQLNLGYLSGDYRNQAVAGHIACLFELHDRHQFQVYAYSLGPNDGSEYRRKFESDADVFRDVQQWSSGQIVQQIQDDNIHILIDLEGYTEYARTEIYAHRPAPIIVSYLGHAGTMGADYIDYIITDRAITPPEQVKHLTEKCLYLPVSAMITDNQQALLPAPSRSEIGLPDTGFIFCAFHKNQKIDATIFATWMRILQQVPDSYLWLLQTNTPAQQNLRQAAQSAGIERDRLIFAPHLPRPDYLARFQVADLFLDTLHMNAYATGVDVLRAGLPLITCPGNTVAARIAASLLLAADVPDLIADNIENYEQLAVHLATHPDVLSTYRQLLKPERLLSTLFNTEQTVRHLESAYGQIWTEFQVSKQQHKPIQNWSEVSAT